MNETNETILTITNSITSNPNYIWVIIIGAILLLIIIIWFLRRAIKKRKVKEIPQDVLDIFNEAEKRMKEMKGGDFENGNCNPYKILWDIYREKQRGGRIRQADSTIEREDSAIRGDKEQTSNPDIDGERGRVQEVRDTSIDADAGRTNKDNKRDKPNRRFTPI